MHVWRTEYSRPYAVWNNAVLSSGIMPKASSHCWWVHLSTTPGRRPASFPTPHTGVVCEVAVNRLQSLRSFPYDS